MHVNGHAHYNAHGLVHAEHGNECCSMRLYVQCSQLSALYAGVETAQAPPALIVAQ